MSGLEVGLAAVLVAVLGYAGGKYLFKKDDQWERTAENLLDLSGALQEYGLKDIPRGLRLAAIKDVSGVVEIIKFYVDLLRRDPNAVVAEFDKIFERVLEKKMADPASRALLQANLIKAESTKDAA